MILRVHLRELNDFVSVDTATVETQCIVAPVEPLYKTVPIDAGDMKICSFPLVALYFGQNKPEWSNIAFRF
jgi:hypothetical protein